MQMQRFINTLKNIRTIIWVSVSIPVVFILLVAVRRYIEYYYRFSATQKYIYTYGSVTCMFIQIALVFLSLITGILLIIDFKKYSVPEKWVILIFGTSLFLYINISLCSAFFW